MSSSENTISWLDIPGMVSTLEHHKKMITNILAPKNSGLINISALTLKEYHLYVVMVYYTLTLNTKLIS
jgi:hypothetical protein